MEDESVEPKSHLHEKTKVESPVDNKPEESSPCDVTPLHHNLNSGSCDTRNIDERRIHNPVDVRHLDSVFQYTSKIRAFIGLVDPEENNSSPVSAPVDENNKTALVDSDNLKPADNINSDCDDINEDENDVQYTGRENDVRIDEPAIKETPEDSNNDLLTIPNNQESADCDESVSNPQLNGSDNVTSIDEPIVERNLENAKNDYRNQKLNDSDYINEVVGNSHLNGSENDTRRDFPVLKEDNLETKSDVIEVGLDTSLSENIQPLSDQSETKEDIIETGTETSPDKDIPQLKNHSEDNAIGVDLESSPVENIQSVPTINSDILSLEKALVEADEKNEQDSLKPLNVNENTLDSSDNAVIAEFPSDKDEKNPLDEIKTLDKTRVDIVNAGHETGTICELNETLNLAKTLNMTTSTPDDNIKSYLLNDHNSSEGLNLNDPEIIIRDEELNSPRSNIRDELEQDLKKLNDFPANGHPVSAVNSDEKKDSECMEQIHLKNEDDGTANVKDLPNGLYNELDSTAEEQNINEISDEKSPSTPRIDHIRRLSLEIVNKVLDTAGNQLRDMLNEKRQSNVALGNANLSSDLKNNGAEFGHELQGSVLQNVDGSQNSEKHISDNEIQLKDVLKKTYDFNDFQKKIEVEMNKFDPRYDVDPDIVCGIGCFKPKWIQPYATAKVYLILYSIIGILSGSYYSYLIGALSTLEKRFAFKSKTSGVIMTLDEITPVVLGVFVGYFGGKTHRPRMVAFGMLLSTICCFVSALPYFIYGPGAHLSLSDVKNKTGLELCDQNMNENGSCDSDSRPRTLVPVLFLMFGSFLKGFGNLAYYSIGLAYMDDNAKKKNTPMYFAVAFALRLLGPMVGFLMSSFFLKYYENPFVDPGFPPEDPRWIGCWWMGFLVQGILLFIFTAPIALFPRRLPGTVLRTKAEGFQGLVSSFAGLYSALKRLLKNPLFILIIINTVAAIFGAFGHYIMLPKYMENQFRLSASNASLLSGPPSIGSVMISTVIGGYLIWRFKPSAKFLTAGIFTLEIVSATGYLLLMIPRCQTVEVANYGSDSQGLILESACNVNCNCSKSAFTPVCGPDGKTLFFSPCYAGCSQKANESYTDCSCVFDSTGQERNYVIEGPCVNEHCWSQALAYIITMPFIQLIVSLLRVAHTMILLRSILPEDKSVALGTFEAFICIFGFIPFPVVYGALVDSACLVFEERCGETGNCWIYDNSKLGYLLHGASAMFTVLAAISQLGVHFLSGRVGNLYEEDDEIEDSAAENKKKEAAEDQRIRQESLTKL